MRSFLRVTSKSEHRDYTSSDSHERYELDTIWLEMLNTEGEHFAILISDMSVDYSWCF